MNTKSNAMNGTGAALLLLGLAWTGGAIGQEAGQLPSPEVDRASCENVNWHQDLLGRYPWAVDACHEVVVVEGQKWARFEAEFQRVNNDGSIVSAFKNRQGRSHGNITLMPGPDQRVSLDGRPYRFSELRRGQTLNFYVPEGVNGFAAVPGAPTQDLVRVVEQPAPSGRTVALAQAEPRPAPIPQRLPSTAGPLPAIALAGLVLLLAGFGLGMRRRFPRHGG